MIADGPGARARAELLENPDRLDAVIAKAADASKTTVWRARRQLADLGLIEASGPGLSDDACSSGPARTASPPGLALSPLQRALLEAEADPQASDHRLAERARCGRTTVRMARAYLEREQIIPVIPASQRERRSQLGQVQERWDWSQLPPRPASMSAGLCVTGGHDPDLWSSTNRNPARRVQAIAICHQCPALADCREWSLQLPTSEKWGIYGGLSSHARVQLRKQRERQAQPARPHSLVLQLPRGPSL